MQPEFIAWRTCYLVVGWMQVVAGGAVSPAQPAGGLRAAGGQGGPGEVPYLQAERLELTPARRPASPTPTPPRPPPQTLLLGQDLPRGNYAALRRRGALPAPNSARAYWAAGRNYRTWAAFCLYGFSFGVELTMYNGGCWGFARGQWRAERWRPPSAPAPALPSPHARPSLTCRPLAAPLPSPFPARMQSLPNTSTILSRSA